MRCFSVGVHSPNTVDRGGERKRVRKSEKDGDGERTKKIISLLYIVNSIADTTEMLLIPLQPNFVSKEISKISSFSLLYLALAYLN